MVTTDKLTLETIKTFYELLGHKKQTEIRMMELSPDFKTSKVKGHYFVSSLQDFINKIEENNGKYNLYAGLNERVEQGTLAKDVVSVKNIFVDIDCIKKPASEEDLKEAERVTNEIISDIHKQTGGEPTKIYSGNGFQLIYSIPEIKITDENREDVESKIQQFLKNLIKKYSNNKVKLDNVGDLPRIIRITGTINIKGNKISEFMEINKKKSQFLNAYIMNLKTESAEKIIDGDKKKDTSRSGKEIKEVCKLLFKGMNKEQVFTEMEMFAKWSEGSEQYKETTYNNALDWVKRRKENDEDVGTEDALLLLKDEEEKSYLDLGYYGNVFYYGKEIAERESIITSEGKILRNSLKKIEDDEGKVSYTGNNPIKKLFQYDSYIGDISPRISSDIIKKFIKEKYVVDKTDIANRIKDTINYFMGFDLSEIKHVDKVETCWTLATYNYPAYYWFPHLLFNGPQQSGKSKNGFIIKEISFGGYDLGASAGVTPAQIFRTIEGNRGTIMLDEFEQQSGKKESDSQILVNQIMNASAERGSYVIRTEKVGKKWKSWKFPIFCPKFCCNISGINPTSLTRYIVVPLLKTKDKTKLKRKPWIRKEKVRFQPIRDACHILMLQGGAREIRDIYENLQVDLSGREEDNWLPILAVAKWIGDDWYNDVLEFVKNYKEIKIETNSLEEELFLGLTEKVIIENIEWYSTKTIAGWLGDLLESYKNPGNWIGRILTKYKFKSKHKSEGNGYYLSKEMVNNIYNLYFNPKQSSDTSFHSQTSDSSDSSEKDELSELSELMKYQKVDDFDKKQQIIPILEDVKKSQKSVLLTFEKNAKNEGIKKQPEKKKFSGNPNLPKDFDYGEKTNYEDKFMQGNVEIRDEPPTKWVEEDFSQ